MFKPEIIGEIASKLASSFPFQAKDFSNMEQHFKQVLAESLAKHNLVTREEFDTQTRVLQAAYKKLRELEDKITAYENKAANCK